MSKVTCDLLEGEVSTAWRGSSTELMYSHSILLWIAVDIATIPPEEAEKVAVLWVDAF